VKVKAMRGFDLRPATLAEREELSGLISQSALELSKEYYERGQVEAALRGAFAVDTSLIEDGTYFVAESGTTLIGCGGWSRRKTMFGGDQFSARDAALLDPKSEPARIRAFFIHPAWARKGVGRAILARCEEEAAGEGFTSFELMATLPGVPFYLACGYQERARAHFNLTDAIEIEFVPMTKRLPGFA